MILENILAGEFVLTGEVAEVLGSRAFLSSAEVTR